MTVSDIIKELGGDPALARLCGVARQAVNVWHFKGFPATRARQLRDIAHSLNLLHISIDDILSAAPMRRPPEPPTSLQQKGY